MKYICRSCGMTIGHLDPTQVTERALGFDCLTIDERQEIIQYQENGEIHVQIICEHCQEALERHPELHLQSTPLQ